MQQRYGKLPSEMRVEWRKIDKNTFSSFKDLMVFIEAEAEGQEYASIIGEQKQKTPTKPKEEVSFTGSATQLAATAQPDQKRHFGRHNNNKKCIFCGEFHFEVQCTLPLAKRMEIIERY